MITGNDLAKIASLNKRDLNRVVYQISIGDVLNIMAQTMRESGIELSEVTPEKMQAILKAIWPAFEDLDPLPGADVVDRVLYKIFP